MKDVIVSDKYCFSGGRVIDQFHSLRFTKYKTCRAQSIGFGGRIADNGYSKEIIFIGIASAWIENMVVNCAVHFKIALVDPGRNDRFIFHFDGGNRGSQLIKGTLDSNIKAGPVRFASDCKNIASKIDQGMTHSLFFYIFF